MVSISDAVLSLRPGAAFSVNGESASGVTWLDQVQIRPTDAEIQAEFTRLSGLAPDPLTLWDNISLIIAFNHENRIRALEGKASITQAQFKAALRSLL